MWEHSPTRIKRKGRSRLNRGKDSPINYHTISSILRDTWRPTRAPTWPPCQLARLLRGPHASCHVASAPRRNGTVDPPATWVRSPRQPRLGRLATSAAGNFSPFFAFLTKKYFKKSIKKLNKNQKNSIKLQKFIFLKIQLLFNPNFLHWITNSFLFNIMSFKIYLERRNQNDLQFT